MPWVLILDRALTCMWSYSVVSNSLRPWTVTHQAPLSRDAPGKNTREGCNILLQGIFPTQESNWHLLHCRRTLYHWAIGEARRTPKILLISWLIGTSSAKYLVLVPGSWALKILGISGVGRLSSCVWWDIRGEQTGESELIKGWWFHQWSLCYETPGTTPTWRTSFPYCSGYHIRLTTPTQKGLENFQAGGHIQVLDNRIRVLWDLALHTSPSSCSSVPFIISFMENQQK